MKVLRVLLGMAMLTLGFAGMLLGALMLRVSFEGFLYIACGFYFVVYLLFAVHSQREKREGPKPRPIRRQKEQKRPAIISLSKMKPPRNRAAATTKGDKNTIRRPRRSYR